MEKSTDVLDIYVYGDITPYPESDGDVSSGPVVKAIQETDAKRINVYINSYGGAVSESLAISAALKRTKAHVTTYCDGFACSGASLIFVSGDERIMAQPSLLFLHESVTIGFVMDNAGELRKTADELDLFTGEAKKLYESVMTISVEALDELLKKETWLSPEQALEMGFATAIGQSAGAIMLSRAGAVMHRPHKAETDEERTGTTASALDALAENISQRLSALLLEKAETEVVEETKEDEGTNDTDEEQSEDAQDTGPSMQTMFVGMLHNTIKNWEATSK